MQSKGACRQN
jgi:hypothetical protein